MPADKRKFLAAYHASMVAGLQNKLSFRDEGDGDWQAFLEVPGTPVKELQQFLKDAGFMPRASLDGVFGYVTHAAVRLFQEYIRTVEGNPAIGTPDGIVGPNTLQHIEQWKARKKGTPDFVCKWGRASAQTGTEEFRKWTALLQKAKDFFVQNPSPTLQMVDKFPRQSDTLKVRDWNTTPDTIHLIGIRRNQDATARKRENDDLFVLLIKGMVFKFWGSTDPSQSIASTRTDEPFLLEGQHVYKFGWHKISDANQVYRAFKPATVGVLAFRDRDNSNSLTPADIAKGIDSTPNNTINIHWSGKGDTNFSAGCQVIAGQSYINHEGKVIDCSAFASPGYADLKKGKTRGAYNLLTDLILCYAPEGVQTIVYTLGRDETFALSEVIDENTIASWAGSLKEGEGVA
jgi:hypothetical protein